MKTQSEIFNEMQELIPTDLWNKYNRLSFGEMAKVTELADYADELEQAESEWWEAVK